VIATVVDVSICYLLFVVPVVFVPPVLSASFFEAFNGVVVILSLFLLVPIHQTYAFAFEWRYSRTPGKVARGLMVTTTDGGPCSVGTSAVRNIGRYVDFLPGPYFIGLASALLSANGQRIGDMAANTVVVRAKSRDNGATTTDEMRGRNSSS
jgi:uncharacterized RDD family membrane protein YckC